MKKFDDNYLSDCALDKIKPIYPSRCLSITFREEEELQKLLANSEVSLVKADIKKDKN